MILQAISDKTIESVDYNILSRWVNQTLQEIYTSSTLLSVHNENVSKALDRQEELIKNRITTYTKDQATKQAQGLSNHCQNLHKQMGEDFSQYLNNPSNF